MTDDDLTEHVARWLFERNYGDRGLCSADDAEWDDWVERNQDEWRDEARALLASRPLADRLAADEARPDR
jgi:hypothetical protein